MEIRSFFVVLFLSICTVANSDIESDKTALLAFRSAVGRFINWNSDGTPCNWTGIACAAGRVVTLRLPGRDLIGSIPIGTIGNLTKLRTLSLRLNGLTGELPSDLAQCSDLRNLYLQGNQFKGEIPSFLFELRELVRLNLAGNNFSGEIPGGLSNLTRLATLYLENNQLTGSIPNLNLTSLTQFNVSFNQLNGSIPENLRNWDENSFLGTALCGGKLNPCEGTNLSPPGESPTDRDENSSKKKRKLSGGAIAGIVIGSVLGFLLLLLLLFLCCKKSENQTKSLDVAKIPPQPSEVQHPDKTANGEGRANGNHSGFQPSTASVQSATPATVSDDSKKLVVFAHGGNRTGKEFDLEDLLRASAEVLGKGTFGTAYKAVLEIGTVVAVKRLRDVTISEGEFREKIEIVGAMNHENLVPLRAYYYSKDEKLLVYDYMPMGSLSALLHGNRGAGRTPLNWETRSGIALSAAKGIEYLHRQSSTTSHGNIKSSNILLAKNYEARVSDFGLATLVGTVTAPTRVAGYRAPEVTDIRKISQKADIYSFGVLLLELLTGKTPTHSVLNEEGVDLPRWVQSVVREDWTAEVFDLELLRYQKVEEEMVQLLQLAIDCCAQYPDKRPSMTEVVNRIEELRRMSLHREEQDNSLFDDVNVESGSSLP